MLNSVFEELSWRGLVYQTTSPELEKKLKEEKITVYIGFDPTAASLHVGSLVPLMTLFHFRRYGHNVIPLVGGGTGLIGDPSFKAKERPLLTEVEVERLGTCLHNQMHGFLSQLDGGNIYEANNVEWLSKFSFIEFLRDVGKHFSVNEMMRRDSVQMRFGEENSGISFTEFSYMLLQGYDFVELHKRFDCTLQCGASDQWGNIISGVDLVRRMEQKEVYGLTMPLLTKADGKKYGKTESGSVWLDPEMTSPYEFYQFWLNTADEDCEKMLKIFTLLDKAEITELAKTIGSPERTAQKKLSEEITKLVHGDAHTQSAIAASASLFSGSIATLPVDELLKMQNDVPCLLVTSVTGHTLFDLLVQTGAASSKSEARRFTEQGGVKINGSIVDSKADREISEDEFLDGKVLVLQRGKKNNYLVIVK